VHICICTTRAPAGVKSRFLEQLQDALDAIPNSDFLVIVGDFNARVGVIDPQDNLWRGVVGRYGIKERNLAGEDFFYNFVSVTNYPL